MYIIILVKSSQLLGRTLNRLQSGLSSQWRSAANSLYACMTINWIILQEFPFYCRWAHAWEVLRITGNVTMEVCGETVDSDEIVMCNHVTDISQEQRA